MRQSNLRGNRCARRSAILAAAVLAGSVSAGSAYGQTAVNWVGTTGSYTDANNWNPAVVPSNSATPIQFLTINNGGTAQVVTGDAAEGPLLYLGLQPGQSGHLTINGGTMNLGEMRVGGLETIPDLVTPTNPGTPNGGGTGTVIQNGGTVNITALSTMDPPRQSLWIGDAGLSSGNTANGSYTITGTEAAPAVLLNGVATNDGIFVGTGVGTVGAFTQNAFTTVTTTGFLNVARRGATATYNLNGGTLNANAGTANTAMFMGDGDTNGLQSTNGTFNHNAGTFNVNGNMFMGRRGGDGAYNMSAGSLTVTGGTGLVIGDGNDLAAAAGTSGIFNQTGGSVTTSGLLVGRRNGEGTYKISAGSLTGSGEARFPDLGTSTVVGLTAAKGTLDVSGTAAVVFTGNLNIGLGSSTFASTVQGTLTQTGGSITLSGTGATVLAIGNGLGASATANLSGGTLSQTAGSATANFDIGRSSSSGIVNISGTHIFNGRQVTLNSTNVAATRQLNISGGTVDVDLVTFGSVASQSTRLLDISGGTVNIGELSTGQATGTGQALTHIHGGTVTIENTLTFFSGSTFRLSSINLNVPANSTYGNATVDVLGSSVLTLNGTFGTGADARTLTKTGPGTLTVNGAQTYATNAVANINGGTVNYNTNAGTAAANLAVNANSGTTHFNAVQNLRSLSVGDGALAIAQTGLPTALTFGTIATTGTGTGKFDLKNNAAVIKNSNLAAVTALIVAGYNNGDFLGGGITSSTAANDPNFLTAIGYAANLEAAYTTFEGISGLDDNDVLVKYTYYGDADLTGSVDLDDFNLFLAGYQDPANVPQTWIYGDFDYTGSVDLDDFNLFLAAYQANGAPLSALAGAVGDTGLSAGDQQLMLSAIAAVPEPGTLGVLGVVAAGLLARRRRNA
jgi:fibronectin-binding autotransporter adhesin